MKRTAHRRSPTAASSSTSTTTRRRRRASASTTPATCPSTRRASEIRYDAAARRVGGDRLAPAGPHPPAAGRRVPAVPVDATAGRPRSRPTDYDVVVFENRFPSFAGTATRRPVAAARELFARRPGDGPLRGRLLHQRPRRVVRHADARAGAHGRRGLGRPHRRARRAARSSSRSSASRTAARRSASRSPTRTARSTATRSSRRAPARCSTPPERYRERTGANLFADVLAAELADGVAGRDEQRALGGVRAVRGPLARRGAPLPRPARCPTCRRSTTRSATTSPPSTSTCCARSTRSTTRRCRTSAAWHQAPVRVDRDLAYAAPRAVLDPAGRGQAQVPRRLESGMGAFVNDVAAGAGRRHRCATP